MFKNAILLLVSLSKYVPFTVAFNLIIPMVSSVALTLSVILESEPKFPIDHIPVSGFYEPELLSYVYMKLFGSVKLAVTPVALLGP